MSDFIAEEGEDYIGAFAVTAGHGELEIAKRFKDAGDDYSSIHGRRSRRPPRRGVRRTALHKEVRIRAVGLRARRSRPATDDLIAEQYQGIRPAPGYPAQPDHTEKATLFRLLQAEQPTPAWR
jgi:5-methyltetrahydrofolate--homocysteine methyltransferase